MCGLYYYKTVKPGPSTEYGKEIEKLWNVVYRRPLKISWKKKEINEEVLWRMGV